MEFFTALDFVMLYSSESPQCQWLFQSLLGFNLNSIVGHQNIPIIPCLGRVRAIQIYSVTG